MKNLIISFLVFLVSVSFCLEKWDGRGPKNIYYITGAGKFLLDPQGIIGANQDNWSLPYQALANSFVRAGYNFYTELPTIDLASEVHTVFFHNIPSLEVCNKYKSILDKFVILILEPSHVMPPNYDLNLHKLFKKVITFDSRMVDDRKYFQYFFVQSNLKMVDTVVKFSDKRLCTLIGSNKSFFCPNELYSHRKEVINFFEKNNLLGFDFYGFGWNKELYNNYKGKVPSKTDILKKYKFCICYENIKGLNGYVTEKIFGCFIAGCVPVYLGADNITDFVPKDCFVDRRDFKSIEDLYNFMKDITEEEYLNYLFNIKKYLNSELVYKFSIDYFLENIARVFNYKS